MTFPLIWTVFRCHLQSPAIPEMGYRWTSPSECMEYNGYTTNKHLLGGIPTPLKNMRSSVGMIIPNIRKNKNVPNQQTSR